MTVTRYSKLITIGTAAGALLAVRAAFADTTWYLLSTGNSQYNKGVVGNLSYWSTTIGGSAGSGSPTSSDNQVVRGGYTLRVGPSNFTTASKSLTIGVEGSVGKLCHDRGTATYANDGIILANGQYYSNWNPDSSSSYTGAANGKMTVTASASSPFDMYFNYSRMTFTINAQLYGNEGTGIKFRTNSANYSNQTVVVNNPGNYKGSMEISSLRANSDVSYGLLVKLGAMDTPGTISTTGGVVLQTTANYVTVKAGTISLGAGTRLNVLCGSGGVSSKWVVTDSLQVASGVEIKLASSPGTLGTETSYEILRGPDTATWSKADFSVSMGSYGNDFYPAIDEEVDGISHTKSLVLRLTDKVRQIRHLDGETQTARDGVLPSYGSPSSLTNELSWSDSKLPHSGAAYFVLNAVRTLLGTEGTPYEFPGDALFVSGSSGRLISFEPTFIVSKLGALDGGAICMGQSGNVSFKCSGGIVFGPGVVNLMAYSKNRMTFDGEISGDGEVRCMGWDVLSGSMGGSYAFAGMNTNFTGTVRVSQILDSEAVQTLLVSDGRNLGGALPAFNPRALRLDSRGTVSVTNDVTLGADLNRGVYIQGEGRFNPNASCTLRIDQPILLSGRLVKNGGGALVLGGAMTFEDDDGGNVTTASREGSNIVSVVAGSLVAAHADCLNGCAVSFAAGTHLALRTNAADANLRRYGIKMTEGGSSLTLDPSFGGVLPISVETDDPPPANSTQATYVGLVTVPDSKAAAVRAMLPRFPRIWAEVAQRSVEISEDGCTTFALQAKIKGFMIDFR